MRPHSRESGRVSRGSSRWPHGGTSHVDRSRPPGPRPGLGRRSGSARQWCRAVHGAGGLLLFRRQGQRHPSTRAKGLHNLGAQRERRVLHRAAQVRGQRRRLRHGDPDAVAAQAGRDAARLLQGPRDLHDPHAAAAADLRRARSDLSEGGRDAERCWWRRDARCARGRQQEGRDGPRGRSRRLARLQDHRRRGPQGALRLAEGERLLLRRRSGDSRLLYSEEVVLHGHEDRLQANEEEPPTGATWARSLPRASRSNPTNAFIPSRSRSSRSRRRPTLSSTFNRPSKWT